MAVVLQHPAATCRRFGHGTAQPCRSRRLAARSSASTTEAELLAAVDSLGYPAAIFPGDEPARAGIDASIAALEHASPTPAPLQQPDRCGQPSRLLEGAWRLVYASSGTYVTRTPAARALLAASALPGVGVADVHQDLALQDAAAGGPPLRTSNAAAFGLGPFGDWEVCIAGGWDVRDGTRAVVSFDSFTLQLVGLLGLLKLPRMAKVTLPIKNSIQADFFTTYLSRDVRVARGKKSIFVFRRLP